MLICTACRIEMRCIKTGFTVRWGEAHCYRGDKFRCDNCGSEVVHCNSVSFQNSMDWPQNEFLQMPEIQDAVPDGMPKVRDQNCPCDRYSPGVPSGECYGDGHYLCSECEEYKEDEETSI